MKIPTVSDLVRLGTEQFEALRRPGRPWWSGSGPIRKKSPGNRRRSARRSPLNGVK